MKKIKLFSLALMALFATSLWATNYTELFSVTGPTGNNLIQNNVRVISANSIQNKTFAGNSNTKVYKIDSKTLRISSTTANIRKIVFTACYSSSGTSLAKACKVSVSTDSTSFSTLSSGVSVSGGTGTSATSTAGIYVSGYGGSTTVTIEFNTAYRYLHIDKDGAETWINSLQVYMETPAGYTITFEENGHGANQTDLTYQTALPNPLPVLSETGWIFGGWYLDNTTFNTPAEAGAAIAEATTLYAKWTEDPNVEKYSVTYNLNGATGEAPTQPNVAEGIVITLAAAPVRDGYRFDGWLCDIDSKVKTAGASYTMTAAATTFTAQWTPSPRTIFYYQSEISDAPSLNTNLTGVTGGTFTTRSYKTSSPGSFTAQAVGSYVDGTADDMKAASGKKALKWGSSDVYVKLALTSGKLQTGDTVVICGYGGIKMYKSITSGTGFNDEVASLTMSGTSSSIFGVNSTTCVIPQVSSKNVQYDSLCLARNSNGYVTAIKIIRPVYQIICTDAEYGSVVADKELGALNEKVTLTTTPEASYKLNTLTVLKASDDSDVTASVLDGKVLTMPGYAVKVVATFVKDSGTALDNTAEELKAVKRIENGMLIIEKNGVRYNAMGQIIR